MWRFIFAHSLIWMLSLGSIMLYAQEESAINRNVNGNNDNDIQTRIVGGREATCEEFPYQINFIVNNSYFCGGFIISNRDIVTAAHCAQNVDPSTVVLRTGSTYRRNGTIIPIEKVIPYPEYNDPPFDKDIAIMKTAKPIEFGKCTQPIPLTPKGETPKAGSILTVSGWGRTRYPPGIIPVALSQADTVRTLLPNIEPPSNNMLSLLCPCIAIQGASTLPDTLMAVNLTIVAHRRCEIAYPDTITDNMICAGNFFFGGKSTCQGDSGGVGAINGVAKGIVSFGRICGQPLAPSVFTDISSPLMRDFITNITGL